MTFMKYLIGLWHIKPINACARDNDVSGGDKIWNKHLTGAVINNERVRVHDPQGEIMKTSYLTAVLMLTCLLGDGVSAHAQDADAVVVSVPFEFVAGGATLPAGQYRVSRVNPFANRELAISGDNTASVFLLPQAFADGPSNQPTLSFEHAGGKYFLSRIKTLGGVYSIASPRETTMLGKAIAPSPNASSSSGSQ
jgi:hypothetical protein